MQTDNSSNFTLTSNNSQREMLLIPRSQRQSFFIQFSILTLLGWVVGGIASIALEKTIVETIPPSIFQQYLTWYSLGKSFSTNLIFALIFGADQAIVLRGYLSGWLWLLATCFGWLISNSVSTAWISYISAIAASSNLTLSANQTVILGILSTFLYIFSGIWLGFCQFLVLRRYTTNAWWWTFLPSGSFFFISILIWLLSLVQDFIPEANRTQILYLSGQGFTAVILGVVPAIGLCRLKKSPHINGISSSS
ncbi:MAG: hypothetical protein KME38_03475 [Spirirestis rafaelensis WJT71-NPBG6]|jgi:hypothetical protein|nr:hypothetical protein [Spirirestis rafaelensis WJT71-NPBG6]